jgi:hypothetical protein
MPVSLLAARAAPLMLGMLNRGFTTVRDTGGAVTTAQLVEARVEELQITEQIAMRTWSHRPACLYSTL